MPIACPPAPRARNLLGVLIDAEVARRLGVSTTTVRNERARLGIKGRTGRNLDDIGPQETLRRIRVRSRAGEPMRQGQVHSAHLLALCRRFFGGWYQAVEGCRAEARGQAASGGPEPSDSAEASLDPCFAARAKTAAELEVLTGVSRRVIGQRRAKVGVVRPEKQTKDLSWLPSALPHLGKYPDTVLKDVLRASAADISRRASWLTRNHFMWQHEPCFYDWPQGSMPGKARKPVSNATTV